MRNGLVIACTAITALSVPIAGRQQDLTKISGAWQPIKSVPATGLPYRPPSWLTLAHVQAMHAQLAQVADVFHKLPALATPVGFSIYPRRTVAFDRPWTGRREGDLQWGVHGRLELQGSSYILDRGKPIAVGYGDLFNVIVDANDLQRAVGTQEWAADADGTIYLQQSPDDTVKGFPIYNGWAMVTRRTPSLTAPVSQERVMRLRIAEADANVGKADELFKTLGATVPDNFKEARAQWQRIATSLRTQLDAMPPAARQAPAFALGSFDPEHPFVPSGTPDARAVVQPNPAFFDQARPGDIQVLAVHVNCGGCDGDARLSEQLRTDLDWSALAALTR